MGSHLATETTEDGSETWASFGSGDVGGKTWTEPLHSSPGGAADDSPGRKSWVSLEKIQLSPVRDGTGVQHLVYRPQILNQPSAPFLASFARSGAFDSSTCITSHAGAHLFSCTLRKGPALSEAEGVRAGCTL